MPDRDHGWGISSEKMPGANALGTYFEEVPQPWSLSFTPTNIIHGNHLYPSWNSAIQYHKFFYVLAHM